MLINATSWTDMLTSPATMCALFLLALFFVGELVTFFCTSVPRRASAWLQSSNLVILGRLGNGWATHRVVAMEQADHAVTLDEVGSWVTVARAPKAEPDDDQPASGPPPDQLRAFARWLAERGRLGEWDSSDAERRDIPR
jgi:hypothetical protein